MVQTLSVQNVMDLILILVTFQIGTCYAPRECREKNGTGAGECAQGYGVCCVCKFFPNFTIYLFQLIEHPILRIPNFNFPNLRCCKVDFSF